MPAKKGLDKKIAVGSLRGGIIGALTIAFFTYGSTYNIDGSKVKSGLTRRNSLVEYKEDGDKIRYATGFGCDCLDRVVINGKRYTSKDTLVYEEAVKRYNYLNEKIDSIKTVRKESKLKEKLAKEKEDEEKALWVIRK